MRKIVKKASTFFLLAATGVLLKPALCAPWTGVDIGSPATAGSHTFDGQTLSISGSGKGLDFSGKDQLHYVFQAYADQDVEIIARLVSFSGDANAQCGLMLRTTSTPDATVAATVYSHDAWKAPDGSLHTWIGDWGRDNAAPFGRSNNGYPTPLTPPLWLRIDRLGRDYAVYKSPDGKTWSQVHNDGGGAFTPSGPIQIGFFVHSGDSTKSATALFDNIKIGKPRLGYRTSWVGNTFSQDSTGYVSNGISAMYATRDGTIYTNSAYDEAGEAAKVYKDGKVVRGISGNNMAGEGSITGDGKNIYMYHGLYGGAVQKIPLDGDPNRNGKTIFMATPVTDKSGSLISGMAVSGDTLLVGIARSNKVLIANPDAPVFYTAGNSSVNATAEAINTDGVLRPATLAVYQTQRECDYLPYVLPGFDPAQKYSVRLHFVDFKHDKPGERIIGFSAGSHSVEKFDIAATAGGKNKATIQELKDVAPDAKGNITVVLTRVAGSPDPHIVISGLEVLAPDGTLAFALNCGGAAAGKFKSDVAEVADKNFAFERPGPMCTDKSGNVWIIQKTGEFALGSNAGFPSPGAVKCYTLGGKFTGRQITDVVNPVAVAFDPTNGHLLIAEGGTDQNIRVYTDIETAPKLLTTFGAKGGIWSGKTPGLLNDALSGGAARFYQITAIGVDSAGNIYVNNSGSGTDLRKYSPAGKLLWQLNSLHFVDCGDFDPDSDGTQVYTPFKHYTMDYSKSTPGGEWSFTAWNWNPFKYGTPPRNNCSSAVVRRLGSTRNLVMYTSGQGSMGDALVYRFAGEQAIPCARFSEKNGNELWLDKNGDGKESPDEITKADKPTGGWQSYHVDQKGDIWLVCSGGANFMLRHFICQGVVGGAPQYSYGAGGYEDIPFPDSGIKASAWGQGGRVVYDSVRDAMYLMGPGAPRKSDKENTISYLARYDNWSKGNRKARWQIILPDPATDPNFMYTLAMPYGLAYQWEAFDVADDKLFIAEMWGPIHVYDANTGAAETILNAGPQVSGSNAWEDEQMGVRAFKRKNGEYLVLSENSGFRGKNNLYRYRPTIIAAP